MGVDITSKIAFVTVFSAILRNITKITRYFKIAEYIYIFKIAKYIYIYIYIYSTLIWSEKSQSVNFMGNRELLILKAK